MSYSKAKMHQILFRLGLCPGPRLGAYSAPPDLLAGFVGLISVAAFSYLLTFQSTAGRT